MTRQNEKSVFKPRLLAVTFSLGCAVPVLMTLTLAMAWSGRGYADTYSDTVTVKYKKIDQTLNITEVQGVGEDKLLINMKGSGLPKYGYVLLCDGVKTCAPDFNDKDPFKNVSDVVISGISQATKDPALIFFSDPLGLPPEIVDYIKKNKPLGQLQETGEPQELARYFGVKKGGGSVSVKSDLNTPAPEPGALILLVTGVAIPGLRLYTRRRKNRHGKGELS
jgi:hypothetical protein